MQRYCNLPPHFIVLFCCYTAMTQLSESCHSAQFVFPQANSFSDVLHLFKAEPAITDQ